MCDLPHGCRVFSGPFPLPEGLCVYGLDPGVRRCIVRKSGARLLSIHPEVRGGGAKDADRTLVSTRVASLLLGSGVPLSDVTPAVEGLVAAAGVPACLEALSVPESKDGQFAVNATDLPGIWSGMDEEPVGIVECIDAHSSGAVLLDAGEASPEAIARLRALDAEVLCIIVPGHACPDPSSCSGTVSVPVKHRDTGASHLLAACYHNVGQTDAEPYFGEEAKVEVAGMICCSFTMYKEYSAQDEWAQACRAPVRSVIEAFRSAGVVNAIQHPWGRSFRLGTRPAASERADSFQFHGKVPESSLQPLLQVSGYKRVFMVPKTWTRAPLPGWQIVWMSTSFLRKAPACCQSRVA